MTWKQDTALTGCSGRSGFSPLDFDMSGQGTLPTGEGPPGGGRGGEDVRQQSTKRKNPSLLFLSQLTSYLYP